MGIQIKFSKGRPTLDVPEGSNLMKVLLENQIPVASSCKGEGVCAKCRLQIIDGRENLSAKNETELHLAEVHELKMNERISCQTIVNGPITVDATYW